MFRFRCLASAMAALAIMVPSSHAESGWPDWPVTLLTPQAAGGGLDSVARVYAQWLGEELKESVIVDNRPGAGGNIGQGLWRARSRKATPCW